MQLFDCLKTILTGQRITEDDAKSINSFVMCRWLSGDPRSIFVANQLNRYYNIPVDKQYQFAQYLLKHKVKYLRYYKNADFTSDDYENVSKYYNISLEKAVEYTKLMSREELEYINMLYSNQK